MSKTTNKFAPEVRERMVADHECDYPSRWAAVVSIADQRLQLGCVRTGRFAAAQLAGVDLLTPEPLTREQMVSHWLNQEDVDVRKDALGYLKRHGTSEDLPMILEKMPAASSLTSRELLEAALAITARYDMAAAAELVVRTPFYDIDAALLEEVLQGFSRHQAQDLARAIEHRSGKVRERGLREMIERGTVSPELGRRFADDG